MRPRRAGLHFRVRRPHPFRVPISPIVNSHLRSYGEILAEKLRRAPELLSLALENITRWRAQGHSAPHRLEEWEALVRQAQAGGAGLEKLMAVLTGSDERSSRLREFHPFAGVLNREERRQARELCGFRH